VSADPSLLAHDVAQQPALLRTLPDLSQARALVARHRVVRLVGIGSSRHVAAFGAACLETLLGSVATVLPAPGDGVPQPRLSGDDLLVVVSQSGATPALLELARAARSTGSGVLAVTNVPGSPLEGLADAVLPCDAGDEAVVPATKSVTTAMLRLRALAGPVSADALAALAASVQEQVDAAHPVHGTPPGFVVAGGLAGQAVAEEVALKLAEVAGLAAVPESLVDFLHGPAAVHAPVLALLPDGDPNDGALHGHDVQRVPVRTTGDPALDQVVRVVAGQCVALAWARALGVDPDDPKGLAKVTRTR
jgi:glucosamine--fructose-6-phosphate aminotransferase (isomerizing)